jgi:hypothetical protein
MSKVCSNDCVDDHDQHERCSSLPLACRRGHPWGPGQVTASWTPCDCPTSRADPGRGHLVVHCRQPGCDEIWQADVDTLIAAIEDRSRHAVDRGSSQAMPAPNTAWTLLMQAHEHQRSLLRPSHPSAASIAGLRSWIRGCVEAVGEARRLEVLTAASDELANVEKMAVRITAIVDAFHMYASMLERFRRIHQTAMVLPPQSRPLADFAEDERILLSCRATLRKSMQELIATLEADH